MNSVKKSNMNKFGLIYKSINIVNNKIYIGQTINFKKRLNEHKRNSLNKKSRSYNSYFCRALRKYGWDNFKWEIIYPNIPINQLHNMEKFTIGNYNSYNGHNYNSTIGGEGIFGYKHNEETIEKLKINAAGKGNPMYGRHHSKYSTNLMSKLKKNKLLTFQHKNRMSLSRIGHEYNAKLWKVIDPNGGIEIVKNLSKYCRNHCLDAGHMIKVSKGKAKHHKQYKVERIYKEIGNE